MFDFIHIVLFVKHKFYTYFAFLYNYKVYVFDQTEDMEIDSDAETICDENTIQIAEADSTSVDEQDVSAPTQQTFDNSPIIVESHGEDEIEDVQVDSIALQPQNLAYVDIIEQAAQSTKHKGPNDKTELVSDSVYFLIEFCIEIFFFH